MNRTFRNLIAGTALALALSATPLLASPTYAAPQAQSDVARPGQPGRPAARAAGAALLIKATADVTGLTPRQVSDALRGGKSLTQVAQENGKSEQEVISAARATLEAQLQQAVSSGRLTQARADALLQAFDSGAPKLMNDTSLGRPIERARQLPVRAGLVAATAEVTGLDPKAVLEGLRAGKSLAQIAQENGKTADDILAELRRLAEERVDEALESAEDLVDQPGLRP